MNRFHKASARRATLVITLTVVAFSALLQGCGDGDDNSAPSPANTATPIPSPTATRTATLFEKKDLVADEVGRAPVTDPNLVNSWGVALSPTGPFWVANAGTGVSTLYNGSGTPFPSGNALVVTIPLPAGSEGAAAPTGIIFNATTDFVVTKGTNSGPSVFIFATEDGTIAGWNQTVDPTNAVIAADNSGDDAIYKGLAVGSNASGNFLFATNFKAGTVEVFDKNFAAATLSGAFSDPNIPVGFAPFGIQNLGGSLYVTYAKQDEDHHDDVHGPGNGFVDVFDTNGNLVRRFASQGTLNSPWGLAIAPTNFGTFAGAVLVGNFGDGRINAFKQSNGTLLGQLSTAASAPIEISGLWGLIVGNGASGGDANTLYFTSGPDEEQHGLFGSVHPAAP